MGKTRSYIDTSLIIDAVRIDQTARKYRAMAILASERVFLTSDYVWLETVPKMEYQKMTEQVRHAEVFFENAEFVPSSHAIITEAKRLARTYGLAAMDALHAACAIAGGADELITCERPSKPFFRIPLEVLKVVSLHEGA
jgi:predicted nucleic acid-binding protein